MLAKAVYQPAHVSLTHRIREQARSHILDLSTSGRWAFALLLLCFCFYHSGRLLGRRAVDLDLDLGSPHQPRWPNAGLNPWVTRQDAGLAALGQGWPIAAAHGFKPSFGHTEPRRGAEWWGEDFLLTFWSFKK